MVTRRISRSAWWGLRRVRKEFSEEETTEKALKCYKVRQSPKDQRHSKAESWASGDVGDVFAFCARESGDLPVFSILGEDCAASFG